MSKHPPTSSQGASSHLIANPVANLAEALPHGSYIITGGMYGSAQERIIVHTGGLPSAPAPPPPSQQQLSPVFFMPPPSQPETSQRLMNMTHPTTKAAKASRAPSEADEDQNKTTSLSLPSFGGSFDQLSHNNGGSGGGMRSPLLGGEEGPKITRTPLPVIGGKL